MYFLEIHKDFVDFLTESKEKNRDNQGNVPLDWRNTVHTCKLNIISFSC